MFTIHLLEVFARWLDGKNNGLNGLRLGTEVLRLGTADPGFHRKKCVCVVCSSPTERGQTSVGDNSGCGSCAATIDAVSQTAGAAPSLNTDVGCCQLVVLVFLLVVDDIMLVALLVPLVVEDILPLLTVIPLLRFPTSALLPVAMASSLDSGVPAKIRAEV